MVRFLYDFKIFNRGEKMKDIISIKSLKYLFIAISLVFLVSTLANPSSPLAKENYGASSIQSSDEGVLYVGGSGPDNYSKIQDAIDDAGDGYIIFVYRGIYHENIVIDKSLTLIGEEENTTFIDGNKSGDVIHVSADHVVINGFTIRNGGGKEGDAGIDINSGYATISHNIIAHNGRDGIFLNSSSGNTIFQNIISGNKYNGIFLANSFNNTITDNVIVNQTYSPYYSRGIYLRLSSSNIISNNTFADNVGYDIFLIGASYTTVTNNNCINASGLFIGGADVSHWNTHIIKNNYVGGKPLYYYKNIATTVEVPLDAGEVILANCSHFVVQNLDISNGDIGVLLGFSSYNNISNNNIANTIAGIWLTHSSYNTMFNNHISNVGGGIPVTALSSHNTILSNTITHDWEYGMGIWSSSYNTISQNTISNNKQVGIYIMDSSILNEVSYDNIMGNGYGVYISSSFTNIIKNNNFIDNYRNAFFQDSVANVWFRNYWDDHTNFGPEVIAGKIALPWNPNKIIDWKNFDWLPAYEPYEL